MRVWRPPAPNGVGLATCLHDAGQNVSVVNPARIKGFARSELLRTKSDKVDAGLIARFWATMHPESWVPLAPEIRTLQALVRRVDALLVMRTQELNRVEATHETVASSVQEHVVYLDQEIKKLKKQIADHIKQHPELRAKRDLLGSIPEIGETTLPFSQNSRLVHELRYEKVSTYRLKACPASVFTHAVGASE